MPAPKRANTAAATEAAARAAWVRRLDAMATELRAAGAIVVMPYSRGRSDEHPFRVEVKGQGGWSVDGDPQLWYSLAGAELRIRELEGRGQTARLT